MKIRHPQFIKAAGFGLAWAVRVWIGSLRFRYRPLGPHLIPGTPGLEGRYIYAAWHENMLLPTYCFSQRDIWVLVSGHADGQLIGEVFKHLGPRVVYGSSTRGGVEALRRMMRGRDHVHLAITPDGPRGPRRQVQSGAIYLAAKTGMPIVPVGIGYHRPWRAKSWDRFAMPRPGSLATCVTADPITVPPTSDRQELEVYRQQVQDSFAFVSAAAEKWAETEKWSDPGQAPRLGELRQVA